jgi:hypothetical protein
VGNDRSVPWSLPLDPLLVALVVAVAVVTLLWRIEAGRPSREARRRFRRARRAESDAERLLRRAGYEVLDRQVETSWTIEVDGAPREALMRADLLVGRRRRRFIAEVKSGDQVTRADHPQTRRQLLEYQLAYDVDGVLLVDMEEGRVIEVAFPARRKR